MSMRMGVLGHQNDWIWTSEYSNSWRSPDRQARKYDYLRQKHNHEHLSDLKQHKGFPYPDSLSERGPNDFPETTGRLKGGHNVWFPSATKDHVPQRGQAP